MLTLRDLHDLASAHADSRVLTVYLDARVTDPAMRHSWRPALLAALRAERARLRDERDATAFDAAAAHLGTPQPPINGAWGAPGWVAYLTPRGPLHAAGLPVRVPTLVAWRDGPVISPYVRVLKQHRPVAVALVDSRHARLFRYAWGELEALPSLSIDMEDDGPAAPAARASRATSAPAPRGALATERARERRRARFHHLIAALGERLADVAGRDGWVLIGGTRAWASVAGALLPDRLAERALVSETLDSHAPAETIVAEARRAATALRAAQGGRVLDRVLERAGAGGRGAVGVPALQRALRAQAVDELLLTPEFLRAQPDVAEDFVRAALAQGAEVEVLSGGAAERLDRTGDGSAGRLRFAIENPLPREARALAPRQGLVTADALRLG